MNGLNSETVATTGFVRAGSPARSDGPGLTRRQRRVQERAGQKLARRRAGIEDGQEVMKEAVQLYPGRPIEQMTFFFQNYQVPAVCGRPRAVSRKTSEHYVNEGHRMLKDLADMRVGIHNLTDLTYKHIVMIARRSEATEGRGVSYLKNRWTVMTRLLEWVGKPARNGQRLCFTTQRAPGASTSRPIRARSRRGDWTCTRCSSKSGRWSRSCTPRCSCSWASGCA